MSKSPADVPLEGPPALGRGANFARPERRATDVPAAPGVPHDGRLVGRDRELAALDRGLDDAVSGRGRLFLLVGEAGIGKTRLADAVATRARERGALVLWGRCWEGGGAPAYWPWVQLVRAYAHNRDPADLASALEGAAAQLGSIVPEVAGTHGVNTPTATQLGVPPLGAGSGRAAADPEHARFYLFDATTTFLLQASRTQPLLLVLEDLQAADEPSLLLLQFLARQLPGAAVMVVGTYRDIEVRRSAAIGRVLAGLARDGHHLPLGGLRSDDVATFVAAQSGRPARPDVVAAVTAVTEGNPFFVEEFVRLLAAEGRLDTPLPPGQDIRPPDGVRGTIRRRLDPLPEQVLSVLASAAVLGREFDLGSLQAMTEQPSEVLLDILTEAVVAGLVKEVPERPARFRFSHGLIRDTCYDDLSPAHRVRLHRKAGLALERLHRGNPQPHTDELAHHFLQAASPQEADKAIHYSIQAARRSAASLAWEQAVAQYSRALQAWDLADHDDLAGRCDLLLAMGDAQAHAGENLTARQTFFEAAQVARELGSAPRLATAALGCGGATPTAGVVDTWLVTLLEEALARLGSTPTVLRARVLGRLAMELYYTADRERRAAMTAEAVEIARGSGDRSALAAALLARHFALWGLEDAEERAGAAREIIRLAQESGDRELELEGHTWLVHALLQDGDITGVDGELHAHRHLAEELRHPYHRWQSKVFLAMRATLAGRFDEGERLAEQAHAIGESQQDPVLGMSFGPNAAMTYGIQLFTLRREQDRLGELEDDVRRFARLYPTLPVWRCALAYLLAADGRLDEARAELDRLAAGDFADLPQDGNWFVAVASLAETAAIVGDAPRAALLHELLLPYDGRHLVVGQAAASRGVTSHYLGLLAATTGALDDAVRHLRDAQGQYDRMGAAPAAARTRVAHAKALLQRDTLGDHDGARMLLERAVALFTELGLPGAAQQASALLGPPGGPPAAPPDSGALAGSALAGSALAGSAPAAAAPAAAALDASRIQREGEYWSLAFDGVVTRCKDSKGLRYLAELLTNPGQEQHCMDLVDVTRTPAASMNAATAAVVADAELVSLDLGDAGSVLDPQAKAAYRQRLADLREELEEAEAFADPERAARAREEIDFLVQELAAGVGLGGRDRKAASASERARVGVTRAVRTAIARIGEGHPALGQHLDRTVRTGVYCSYVPDPRLPVTWTR